ncbi:hypothetical protein RCO27_08350 [Sphingosinicella sp. LHD-64]|uniref:hypothetical protein n=1 Tax=Sphingosinicella sp. LHD-64 TaxID=3072139 RepID=UPI00280DE6E3|nr:hypothetical protein [Sphingosinicella sp. LHD-64]MDQ8756241.1 hypothetical protein [Sphingosinicella sp. LHD-64]
MDDTIVITGRRFPEMYYDFWFLRGWAENGFSSYTIWDSVGGGGSVGNVESEVPSDTTTFDIVIPATEDRPRIELNDLTKAQAEKVFDFLDRVGRDSRLDAALEQMADRNVTLKITFADSLPSGADPTARAVVQFTPMLEPDLQTEGFQPNSTVQITIDRDQINSSSWESTIEGILAHEFTHFYRDATGRFIDDIYNGETPGNSVQDFDDGVYQNLYGTAIDGHYNDSFDIIYPSLSLGQLVNVQGTDGNNHIEFENDMSDATVHTGGGNDFVFTMDGNDTVWANIGGGVKAVYDRGTGYDMVAVPWGFLDIKLSVINSDLYLTSKQSTYSPVDDPNAVIFLDHSDTLGIEYVRSQDGSLLDLPWLWSIQSTAPKSVNFAELPKEIAAAYAAGAVGTATLAGTEAIPEHLQHLVGGATTMTVYEVVPPGKTGFDVVDEAVFAEAHQRSNLAVDYFVGGTMVDSYFAQVACV